MYKLPDGSTFFVGLVGGPRERGLLNLLKHGTKNRARRWLFVWRMYRDAYTMSRWPDQGPPMSRLQCLRYALRYP